MEQSIALRQGLLDCSRGWGDPFAGQLAGQSSGQDCSNPSGEVGRLSVVEGGGAYDHALVLLRRVGIRTFVPHDRRSETGVLLVLAIVSAVVVDRGKGISVHGRVREGSGPPGNVACP